MNLVDHDLTEYQITQTLTLSGLHAHLEQTRRIRRFTHTHTHAQRVDLTDKGNPTVKSPSGANKKSFVHSSVQCSANLWYANPWKEFIEWIHG